jgi:putative holliday junction resolvase
MSFNRILALDYGQKRIGVAISDALGLTAQPKPFIENTDNAVQKINELIQDFEISKLYLGLPQHTRGGETKKSEEVRGFAEKLKLSITIEIEFIDERFSTVAATRQLDASGLNRKKQRLLIDSQAAAFLLQGILDKK